MRNRHFAGRPVYYLFACAVLSTPLANSHVAAQIYRDPSRPIEERVEDLVSRMTLEEKVRQMQNDTPAIPRLGVPHYDYWNEALHGVARGGEATVFPQAIGMAATWDADLARQEGNTVGIEARARYNAAQREGNTSRYFGLTFWAPNLNIFRDPRWGRGQETLGEDPFLTGRLGTEFVKGVQGDDPRYLLAIATPKHFAVHSGPEPLRHGFNVNPSSRDLFGTYLPAFREAITEGKADSLMCSYNAVNGDPACANTLLLRNILRKDWQFAGFVTSDCGAIHDIWRGHHYAQNEAEAAALAVKAGTDTTCGNEYAHLVQAVKAGMVSEHAIDLALERLFTARVRLGMFDPPSSVPFSSIPLSQNHSAQHRELALRAARESIVLLKNSDVLPLKNPPRIAVIGPGATSLIALEGNYKGTPVNPMLPLDGITGVFNRSVVTYAQGAPYVSGLPLPVPRTAFPGGLRAEFFSGTEFSGAAIATRTDKQIDFDWNAVSPANGVNPNSFSVRWTGSIQVPSPGEYSFQIDDRHCDPSDDVENYVVRIEGAPEFRASSSCTDSGRPRKSFSVRFANTPPRKFELEYTHRSPRFSAGVTFSWTAPDKVLLREAREVAARADVVVVFVGLTAWLEGEEMPLHLPGFEGGDRSRLSLPEAQVKLVTALESTGKPVVLVLQSGSAVNLGALADHAGGVLEAWYGGESGGQAIAEVLHGDVSPSGRLPVTFYRSVNDLPSFTDYSMAGRTYRYFRGSPEFPFGFGLSYSRFEYSAARISPAAATAGTSLSVSVQVKNVGAAAGDEVAQLYLSPTNQPAAPALSLRGFQRISLNPGEEKTIRFQLTPRDQAFAGNDGAIRVLPGSYHIWIGGGQPNTHASGTSVDFQVTGQTTLEP